MSVHDFRRLLAGATQLMRSGRLVDATAAIQAALGGQPVTTAPPGEVIDIVAREISDDDAAPAKRPEAAPQSPEAAAGTFTPGSFRNDCGERDYKLFVPPAADAGGARPLVVMLHGCTQDPDDFARGTGMNALAREHGFLVLYPAQSRRANAQGCWNWFKHNHQARDRGEPGVLAGMVREVVERHGVDAGRVYVAGLSAGGAMAAILGDAYPDLFAAVGVHSGLPTGAARDVPGAFAAMKGAAGAIAPAATHGRAPPTIVFHGDADATVAVVNGERVIAAAGSDGASSVERAQANGRSFSRRVIRDGQGDERDELWTIHGAGHAWSGGRPGGTYADPAGPDASAEMLRFFLAHPRTRSR